MHGDGSKEETGRVNFNSERFRVESVRSYLEAMPEAPNCDEEPPAPPPPPQLRRLSHSSMMEPPSRGFKRLWTRRRSSVNPNVNQLTLSHYMTKEVRPNLDNYRMSIGGAGWIICQIF